MSPSSPEPEFPTEARIIRLHGIFDPTGSIRSDIRIVAEFQSEIEDHLDRIRQRELEKDDRDWSNFKQALDQATPLIQSAISGKRSPDEAGAKLRELVPDETARRRIFEWYQKLFDQSPEDREREVSELAEKKQEHEVAVTRMRRRSATYDSLLEMFADASSDPVAAADLLELATLATALLSNASKQSPEMFKGAAAMAHLWPVLAKDEPGWEKEPNARITSLGLGTGLAVFKTPLRQLRGADEGYPSRMWAKAAIAAIDETRWRHVFVTSILGKLGGSGNVADFLVDRNWDLMESPDWAEAAAKLKPFSRSTFADWSDVVRHVIRQQSPEFHQLSEWSVQRLTAEASARDSKGELQNAILDDVISTLKRMIPKETC